MKMTGVEKRKHEVKFVGGMNVRRDEREPDVWREAPLGKVVRNDGWIPWKTLIMEGAPGRASVWFRKGNTLGYGLTMTGEIADVGMEVTTAVSLKGEPVDITDIKGGWLRIAVRGCRGVYATYTPAGEVTVWGEMPELPWLRFERGSESTTSIGFGTVHLSGESDGRGSQLTEGDLETISFAAQKAYRKLRERINGTGRFMQPIVARYRLLDGNGETIVSSAPVVVAASDGMQCCGEIQLTSIDNLATIAAGSLSGKGFKVNLCGMTAIAAPWNRLVRRVVVELSGEIDPMDSKGMCSARVSNDGKICAVNVKLPTGGTRQHHQMIVEALGKIADYDEYLVVDEPFGTEAVSHAEIPVYAAGCRTTLKDCGIGRHPMHDGISYGGISACGNRYIAWNESREIWRGYPAECFATVTGDSTWQALAEVTMGTGADEGVRLVSASSGEDSSPAEFSPLLIYPDAEARELTLSLKTGGKTVSERYPLTPLPGAGCSFYLNETLKGIMPKSELDDMPAQSEVTPLKATRPGFTGVFADTGCHRMIDGIDCRGSKTVRAVTAPRNNGSWDFSRSRLLIFGTDGTRVATLDSEGRFHSVAPLDPRCVAGSAAVAAGAGKKGLTYFAIAGGDVTEVERSGVTTLANGAEGDMAGWCSRHNEIWVNDNITGTLRMNPTRPHETIICTPEEGATVTEMTEWGGSLLVSCSDGKVYDTSQETDENEGCSIALALRFASPQKRAGLQLLEIPIRAAMFRGTISIYGDNGTELPGLLSSYSINGAINDTMPLKLAAPWRKFLEIHFAGKAKELIISNW